MGILIFIILFIFSIVAGFNGMPWMLTFPVISILIIVFSLLNRNEFKEYGTDYKNKKIKLMNNERNHLEFTDEDIDNFIIYDSINKK